MEVLLWLAEWTKRDGRKLGWMSGVGKGKNTLGLMPTFSQGTKHSSKGKFQENSFFIDSNFMIDYNKVWSLFYRPPSHLKFKI